MNHTSSQSLLRSFHSLRGTRLQRAPCKGVMFTRLFLFLILAASSKTAVGCDFTEEYLDELVEHTRTALAEYSACLDSVSNHVRWIEISECRNKTSFENCEELVEEKLNSILNQDNGAIENSDHCNVFRPETEKIHARIVNKGVQKCKT